MRLGVLITLGRAIRVSVVVVERGGDLIHQNRLKRAKSKAHGVPASSMCLVHSGEEPRLCRGVETGMPKLRRSLLGAAVLLLASASLASAATPAWKCSGRTMPGYGGNEPVTILNGVVTEKEHLTEIFASSDIDSLEVTCWNPDNGKFRIAPGVPAILIWTKSFVEASEHLAEARQAAEAKASWELQVLWEAGGNETR